MVERALTGRKKCSPLRRQPAAVGRGDRSAGDYVVNVGMILELSPPGMQDAEEARQVAAHMPGIETELLHRRR
jgi:hypothetical protein